MRKEEAEERWAAMLYSPMRYWYTGVCGEDVVTMRRGEGECEEMTARADDTIRANSGVENADSKNNLLHLVSDPEP
jgi:hypothetical protein